MLVVSDATAITSLLKIGRIEILSQIFREVVIPGAVHAELLQYHSSVPEFLQVRAVMDAHLLPPLLLELDEGEAESIALALELKADVLLIDERKGRRIAQRRGISCLGLAGVLLLAKEKGLIPSVKTILKDLETDARFYLSSDLKLEVLRRAGE